MEQLIRIGIPRRISLREWARRGMAILRKTGTATRRIGRDAAAQAAFEACALEGAGIEFATVELDGRRYGAVYVDGRLNCLLPDASRL